jgi:hypothetical protein
MEDSHIVMHKEQFLNRFFSLEHEGTFFSKTITFEIFYISNCSIVYSISDVKNAGTSYTQLLTKSEFLSVLRNLYINDIDSSINNKVDEIGTLVINSNNQTEFQNLNFFFQRIFMIGEINRNTRLHFFEDSWSFKSDFVEISISDNSIIMNFGRGKEQYRVKNCEERYIVKYLNLNPERYLNFERLNIKKYKYFEMTDGVIEKYFRL